MASIDIIVPCYQYGRYLRECIESILSQQVANLRVLILNDASPDNTDEVAKELLMADPRVSYVCHTTNKGHISTYNEGIEWASADYCLLLSADDYLLSGALSRAISLFERSPEVGLVFGNAYEIDDQGGKQLTNCVPCLESECIVEGMKFLKLSGPHNIVPTPTAIVRTSLQKALGGYKPELPHTGDMELWFRLAAHAHIGFIKDPQAVYRRHSNNMSLQYAAQSYLPDVKQRKAALDVFFATCGSKISRSNQLKNKLFRSLALDAISFASVAFNKGDLNLANQLTQQALQISPFSRISLTWAKVQCKRQLGFKVWQAIHPAIALSGEKAASK